MAELRAHFRPEFVNRVDDVVLLKPLTLKETGRIVDLQVADVLAVADRRRRLELTEDARALIAREGHDRVYGARPLRRFISHEVESRIGRALRAADITDGSTTTLRRRRGPARRVLDCTRGGRAHARDAMAGPPADLHQRSGAWHCGA